MSATSEEKGTPTERGPGEEAATSKEKGRAETAPRGRAGYDSSTVDDTMREHLKELNPDDFE
ncbi:hypothetical protein [Sphaerisporangium fuscum]|uniref:hypothetical protein n=1 Tax=Sphaerisporangium fuscum TaxID=2835868 RepID=UPI001BDC5C6E|nr:hypothetical protein [Sphaerisporangium fuscum]